jgi:uncharacterized protein
MSRSPSKKKRILRCPICRQLVTAKDPEFPFCSEHCRTIDLGKWASGAYRISSPILDSGLRDPSVLEDPDNMGNRSSDDE